TSPLSGKQRPNCSVSRRGRCSPRTRSSLSPSQFPAFSIALGTPWWGEDTSDPPCNFSSCRPSLSRWKTLLLGLPI
ncbi:hypothetical protein C0991_009468, partial [Blastosporella zonata]